MGEKQNSKKLQQYKTEENTRMIVFCDIFVSNKEKLSK